MRWTARFGALSILLAALGGVQAQTYTPGNLPVMTPPGAGCAGPGQPIVIPPAPVPGNVMPGPITPGPISPSPVIPGPISPSPIVPAPLPSAPNIPSSPSPITPSPITPSPISPSPISPAPISPAPSAPSFPAAPTPAPSPSMDTPSLASAAPAAGSGALASSAPNMIGDFGIGAAAELRGVSRSFRVPLVTRGGFKIAENESPRPQDRVFFNYNYFNNITVFGGGPNFDLHRQTFGFEKTLLGGDASIGLRLPLLQKDGLYGPGIDGFGDLTIVTKYAFVNDCNTGNVLSGGLVVTVPTGRDIILGDDSRLNTVLLQPWAGFILNADRFYVHGFTSIVVPTDDTDITFYTADLGVGYRLYQSPDCDRLITSLTPTFEFHTNIPVTNRGVSSGEAVVFPDQFILTGGVHIGLGSCSFLTIGAAMPISGPKPYDFELMCQFNVRF